MACDVLVLTAKFGQGHISVSNAIRTMFQEKEGALKVACVDPFDYFCEDYSFYQDIYKNLSLFTPKLYHMLYRYKEKWPNNLLDAYIYRKYWKEMEEILAFYQPKVIISTFPMCSGLVARVKRYRYMKLPLITVITDVVDSWEWIHEETDYYCVAAPHIADLLKQKGVLEHKISVTGIPVKKDFLKSEKVQGNEKWKILIIANALKNFKINEKTLKELETLTNYEFTLVTGTQKKLYEKLQGSSFDNIRILGYVKNMHEIMKESDFVVTKPGGITIHEAIHCETPMFLSTKPIGQEKINANFIEQAEMGLSISDLTDLKHILLGLEEDYKPYRVWKGNLKKAKEWQKQDAILEQVSSLIRDLA